METDPFPTKMVYNDHTFYLQTSGRYYSDGNKNVPERLLHRRVWFDAHGQIPEGYEIHHKDNDWTNNSLDNLECMCGSQHASDHMKKRWENPEQREKLLLHNAANRELTKAWHASPEGLHWHSENAKQAWLTRSFVDLTCIGCGSMFQSQVSTSQWCNSACWQRANKHRIKRESRVCVMCGNGFECKKYTKTSTCSLVFRSYLIAFNRKDRKTPITKVPTSTPKTPPASP